MRSLEKDIRIGSGNVRTSLKEGSQNSANGFSKNAAKYKVVLIEEGLGNLRDCFYYTKECLEKSASIFEGAKCFADHPSELEEQIRPERSTRDIIGHFENVTYVEQEDGRGCLEADLMVLTGQNYDWAKSLLINALEYSKKYSKSDFVGLSINASGEATQVPIDEFLKSTNVSKSVADKILQAKEEGITEIRPVTVLKDAISCDLVTEAGAGGKILKMIEGERKTMKKNKEAAEKKENEKEAMEKHGKEAKGHEGSEADIGGDGDGHDDAAQDKELISKMIKQYLGDDHAEDQEAHEMAKHAYEAYQSEGMEGNEAYEAAGKHLKMALKIGKNIMKGQKEADDGKDPKDAKDGDDHDADDKHAEASEKEGEAESEKKEAQEAPKKEAALRAELIKAKAEIAKLAESLKKFELTEYLDKKLVESKMSNNFTKKFREALGAPSSKAQIDSSLKIFTTAVAAKGEEVAEDPYFVFTEKTNLKESDGGQGKLGSLADCRQD